MDRKNRKLVNDGKEFERFDEFLTELVKVPKDEILKREKAEKEKNKARKAKKS
jgi:hypothetical protein